MTDGTKVFAKDVKLPKGVVLDMDGEESVVSVTVPEDAAPAEAAAPAADAAAAPAAAAPAAEEK